MENVEKIFIDIKSFIKLVDKEVSSINEDNIDIKLKNINSFIKQIEKKKNDIKTNSTKEYYTLICDRIHNEVKQISTKFDSIAEVKKEKIKIIGEELSKTVNKKKLINYQR